MGLRVDLTSVICNAASLEVLIVSRQLIKQSVFDTSWLSLVVITCSHHTCTKRSIDKPPIRSVILVSNVSKY